MSDSDLDESIAGFNNLNENKKDIVRKLVQYMNQTKKQTTQTKKK